MERGENTPSSTYRRSNPPRTQHQQQHHNQRYRQQHLQHGSAIDQDQQNVDLNEIFFPPFPSSSIAESSSLIPCFNDTSNLYSPYAQAEAFQNSAIVQDFNAQPNIAVTIPQRHDGGADQEIQDFRDDDSAAREQENTRLCQLKDEQGLSWKEIRNMFLAEFQRDYTVPALQMRYRRLRRRLLLDFSDNDQTALLHAYEYWDTKRWEIIAAKMPDFGATEDWTPKACATAWRRLQQGMHASGS